MIEINLTQDFKGKDIKFKTDKDGNLKRLTPELFWVALGRLNNE